MLNKEFVELKNPSIPNAETIAVIKEAERIADDPNVPSYSNIDDLKDALLKE